MQNFRAGFAAVATRNIVECAGAAGQLPAKAGSRTISAATHRAIQIRKFLASASSVVFMVCFLEFMMTM